MHAMKKIKSLLFLGLFMMTSCLDIFLSSTYKCNFLGADNKQ